jgi:predicted nucleotidyltransferase
VRLAVLFGSAARGDDRSDSDLDVLVDLKDDSSIAADALGGRLERRLSRPIDIARLSRTRRDIPLSLLDAIDDGRVLVDRDEQWSGVRSAREEVARAAEERLRADRRRAAESLHALLDAA